MRKIKKKDAKLIEAVANNNIMEIRGGVTGGFLGFGKADPNAMDGYGRSSLHFAQSREAVEILVAAGADVERHGNYWDDGDKRPIHVAENAEVTKALIAAGANVNSRYKDSLQTALFVADAQQAALLIEAGAEVNPFNRYRETPMDVVDDSVKAILREHGGKTAEDFSKEREAGANKQYRDRIKKEDINRTK